MLFFLLYKAGLIIALVTPRQIAYKLASLVSMIKYSFSRGENREMIDNLRNVLPGKTASELEECSKSIVINFSKYLVDFFRFEKLDLAYLDKHIKIINRDYVDEALKKGKGVILVTAHLGNWELGGAIMGILGYKINVIALDHKNERVNRFFVQQRRMKNENVISVSFALRKSLCALKNNEALAIVGDRDFTNNGTIVKFFGRDTLLPKGPALLSLKTGATIIPGFVIRTSGENFELQFDAPIEHPPTGNFEKDMTSLVQRYASVMEKYIKQYPSQWYCFRRFWQK